MVHGIREVFLTDLENLDWMDEETKRKAKKKVCNFSHWLRLFIIKAVFVDRLNSLFGTW